MSKVKILGFGGSLRQGSFSRTLLEAGLELCPKDAEYEVYTKLSEIPPFNQDLEQDMPEVVLDLKKKIKAADAILISTPEYNYSIPGYLKNAIDWASRPYGQSAWDGKPVAIISHGGMVGGSRSQYHLRQVFVFLNMHPLNKPEVMVPGASEKIKDGKLIDDHTREKIRELMTELVKWTRLLQSK